MDLFSCMYYFPYKPQTYAFACIFILLVLVVSARGIDRFIFTLQEWDQAAKKKIRRNVWSMLGIAFLFFLAAMAFVYYFT